MSIKECESETITNEGEGEYEKREKKKESIHINNNNNNKRAKEPMSLYMKCSKIDYFTETERRITKKKFEKKALNQ